MITCEEMDLRKLLRLMRDACSASGSPEDKRRLLISGLAAMIGADCAEWVGFKGRRPARAKCELRVRCQPVGELLFSRHSRVPFSERDVRLAQWMAAEFPWAPAPSFNPNCGLTRRERLILDLLLQSYGRKEIAKRLGISINTIQGYIKAIYLNFGVHSHAELLRHYFQTRGTEPVPPGVPFPPEVEAV